MSVSSYNRKPPSLGGVPCYCVRLLLIAAATSRCRLHMCGPGIHVKRFSSTAARRFCSQPAYLIFQLLALGCESCSISCSSFSSSPSPRPSPSRASPRVTSARTAARPRRQELRLAMSRRLHLVTPMHQRQAPPLSQVSPAPARQCRRLLADDAPSLPALPLPCHHHRTSVANLASLPPRRAVVHRHLSRRRCHLLTLAPHRVRTMPLPLRLALQTRP